MGDRGVVPRIGERDVAGVDGNGVGPGRTDLEPGEGLTGKAREVFGVTEREAFDDDFSADDDVDVGVGDAVDEMNACRVLGTGRRCEERSDDPPASAGRAVVSWSFLKSRITTGVVAVGR